ncbi:germination protease [Clostridia bacterium]|nr:germination protease [Clostridia bacterium]
MNKNITQNAKNTNRTDLAIENPIKGLQCLERGECFSITEIVIDTDELGAKIGKSKGRYVTLETKYSNRFEQNFEPNFEIDYAETVEELSGEIKKFIPNEGLVFVVGLGNNDITPDSLGPKTANKIFATRHLKDENADFFENLRPVSVLSTGVLAQTGIETAEITEAICKKLSPSAVVIIDALVCSDISRLGKTIQISDAGIAPGSGVKNSRKQLNTKTLGTPVIAIGVPTVVDIHTIIKSYTDIEPDMENMMVTPRDIDKLIDKASDLLANALNHVFHPDFSIEEIKNLTGS